MDHRNPNSLDRAPQRRRVLDFIREELSAGRSFPSYNAIAAHMGWSNHQSARDAIRKLCQFDRVLDHRWDPEAKRSVYSLKAS